MNAELFAATSVHPLPLRERVAPKAPGEGSLSAWSDVEADPSPGFALMRETTLSHKGRGCTTAEATITIQACVRAYERGLSRQVSHGATP